MSQPSPREAAEALRTVGRRAEQAVVGSTRSARWVDWVSGLLFLAYGVTADFLPQYDSVRQVVFMIVIVAMVILGRTRWGATVLGRPNRVRRAAFSPRYTRTVLVSFAVFLVASLVLSVIVTVHVPYLLTGLGVLEAVALIGFGPQLRAGLARVAYRGTGSDSDGLA